MNVKGPHLVGLKVAKHKMYFNLDAKVVVKCQIWHHSHYCDMTQSNLLMLHSSKAGYDGVAHRK